MEVYFFCSFKNSSTYPRRQGNDKICGDLRVSEYNFDRFKSILCLCALCLCCSVQLSVLSLEVIADRRCILMRTCWADGNFLAICHIYQPWCTKSASGLWSGNQNSSPLASLGNFCNQKEPLMTFPLGICSMRPNWILPPSLPLICYRAVFHHLYFFPIPLSWLSVGQLACQSAYLPIVYPVFSKEFKGSQSVIMKIVWHLRIVYCIYF